MKNIVCVFLLLQSAFMVAQIEKLVTPNGKKVTFYPAAPGMADNGLTLENNTVQLGGALTKASVISASFGYPLSIQGLQDINDPDYLLTIDSNGVLHKTSSRNWSLNGNADTDPETDYIGNYDNQDLRLRRGNTRAGQISINNTLLGSSSGSLTGITGQYNTGIGYSSLTGNTSGSNNTTVGGQSLYTNKTGGSNTSAGMGALESMSSLNSNNGIGYRPLTLLTVGEDNVGIGNYAGVYLTVNLNKLTKSTQSVFIGSLTRAPYDDITNQIVIGYDVIGKGSNTVYLGNGSTTSIGGAVDWSIGSDIRLKKDITPSPYGLNFINKLRPVNYKMKTGSQDLQSGFIAQEAEAAANNIGYEFNGVVKPQNEKDFYSLRYAEFVVPLVKAVQERQLQIVSLREQLKSKDAQILEIENRLLKLEQEFK
ncbi:tail fiber domain-containing protein [Flavobacterium sp. ACN6]|uniref:tail fiber domain-containing protein n=1 Tax=Flavobacterium sp. ACN6 TaxID=1920426 RepID=UPI000BB3A765|nr:tail fiber domain-containing protein [Flavobacterium sp. ACN6]PBJ11871.1 hypothetical protein BSF42_26030 [Flavobacterium sp. ACN6]